jgi:purine-binding chemotaxis protein CheW
MMDAPASSRVAAGSNANVPLQFLVFELDGLRIALPIATVQEVVRAVAISPLPQAPPAVEGVINARGTLVPAFDLRQRFGVSPRPLSPDQHLILAFAGPRLAALRVDRAIDLVAVARHDVEIAEQIVPGVGHVDAIARLPDGLLIIQDLERFLSSAETEQVDAALVSALGPPESAAGASGEPT